MVQKILANTKSSTFGEAANAILSAVLREGIFTRRTDVVFDVYKENSIKNAERVKRGSEEAMAFGKSESGHRLKQ